MMLVEMTTHGLTQGVAGIDKKSPATAPARGLILTEARQLVSYAGVTAPFQEPPICGRKATGLQASMRCLRAAPCHRSTLRSAQA